MKLLCPLVLALVLFGACSDSGSTPSLGWQTVEEDNKDTASECRCNYGEMGYASEQACLEAIARTAAEEQETADCIDALLATASEAVIADVVCRIEFSRDLHGCTDSLACGPSSERDACYAMYPEETSCPDCVGLSGDALTECQADFAAFSLEGCF